MPLPKAFSPRQRKRTHRMIALFRSSQIRQDCKVSFEVSPPIKYRTTGTKSPTVPRNAKTTIVSEVCARPSPLAEITAAAEVTIGKFFTFTGPKRQPNPKHLTVE